MKKSPVLILQGVAPVAPQLLRRLNLLMQERCGPCRVVQEHGEGQWSRGTTYHLDGDWSLSPAEVHTHLIAAFGQLTP